jgi:soluble lytic murein transglycosylase-like protein
VARANNLSVTLFTNLIWLESSFSLTLVSRAGAQGIAQIMPRTAARYGLLNPFEPLHAMSVAGTLLRDLNHKFGNFGLAAAAYNAGPRRVSEWIAKRRALPKETRNFVLRITGRSVEDWMDALADDEAPSVPAKAPCLELPPYAHQGLNSLAL